MILYSTFGDAMFILVVWLVYLWLKERYIHIAV